MFGFKKNKNSKSKKSKANGQTAHTGSDESQRIREEALANARNAREALGEDTIQKIAKIMKDRENNAVVKAQAQLKNADADQMLDEFLYMMKDRS